MEIKISDAIAQFLKDKDIRCVFGIIGAGNAHLFDSIGNLGFTEIVSVHHEQAAVMAMGTYYRTSGRLSATIATTGAGSTNTITGVVSCWMDSIPGIIISGNEKSIHADSKNPLRIWGVQGYDCTAMVEKVTKYTARVSDPLNILCELEKAYDVTLAGRPGPVWIDVPMDIQAKKVTAASFKKYQKPAAVEFYPTSKVKSLESGVDELIAMIKKSKRPLFWLGHGIRLARATDKIKSLLESTGIPALVTWQGIDMVDSMHPLIFGRAGVYGQRASNFILQNCDLLIGVGTRLAIPQVGYDTSELARAAKIAVVDIDPLETSKMPERVNLPICADAKLFLNSFLSKTVGVKWPHFDEWLGHCRDYQKRYPDLGPEHADKNGFINSYKFLHRLSEDMKPDQHVVTDMGTALLSGHQILRMKAGQRLMTSTGLGEMGFGLPGALGISFARDRGEVLCLNCDGGMMMNLQELQTIAHHNLPVKIIVFNNDGYLMIKHTQKNLFNSRYTCTDKKSGVSLPDFSKIAMAFGFPSYRVKTWNDYDKYIHDFLYSPGAAICEVFMDPEQFFHPKLGLSLQKDGSIISPPLEDLSPFISREEMKRNMIVGMHPKSEKIES